MPQKITLLLRKKLAKNPEFDITGIPEYADISDFFFRHGIQQKMVRNAPLNTNIFNEKEEKGLSRVHPLSPVILLILKKKRVEMFVEINKK